MHALVAFGVLAGAAASPMIALAPRRMAASAAAVAVQPFSWAAALAASAASTAWAGMPADAVICAVLLPVAGALLWAWWPRPPARGVSRLLIGVTASAMVLPGLVPSAVSTGFGVVVMDVGQGDAILVRDGPATLLVDTGPTTAALGRALRRNGVGVPGTVVITHEHADHNGGLPSLSGRVPATAVFHSAAADVAANHGRAWTRTLGEGDELSIGRIRATVLWPPKEGLPKGTPPNDTSVVLDVRTTAHSALLLGDAESGVQQRIAAEGRSSRSTS